MPPLLDPLRPSRSRRGGPTGLRKGAYEKKHRGSDAGTAPCRPRFLRNGISQGHAQGVSPTGTDGAERLSDSFSRLRVMLGEDMAEINTFYFAR